MDNFPKVSVLMTAFNREKYLAEAIESVLNSHYPNFELIISDDCSTDSTLDIARDYESKDERVKISTNKTNLGDYPNRNMASSLAKGDYIIYCDSDDVMYPHAIQTHIWCFNTFPDAALSFEDIHDDEGPFPRLLIPENAYKRHFFGNYLFSRAPGSVMIKREVFEKMNGFSGKRYIGDFEFWLKVAALFPIVLAPGLLSWARTHEDQEKQYDIIKYRLVSAEVALAALSAETCPLSKLDSQLCSNRIKSNISKLYSKELLKGNIDPRFFKSSLKKLGVGPLETLQYLFY